MAPGRRGPRQDHGGLPGRASPGKRSRWSRGPPPLFPPTPRTDNA
nr:MAG TPA: hypothetical protein [Caudoviricetes sp.]